ncbi:MAG TPA: SDR family NAD(P)-dependent oxidoreductase, partial [Longimicrobiaceae bacterium]|nr:SDR family NAD(P)-dependent oxidoreductase [Longimicrobiaceae bacterium]
LPGRTVVVFGGGAELAGRLAARGAEVVRVEHGSRWHEDGGRVVLRPGEADDYARLAAALRGKGPLHTVHLGSVEETGGPDAASLARGLEAGLFDVLRWVQALADAGMLEREGSLLCVTSGAQAVLGTEALRPWQAALVGLLKVVGQEFPRVRTRSVDVEPGGWEPAVLCELDDLLAGGGEGPEVAWRGRRRWEPGYQEAPLGDAHPAGGVQLRPEGVYLITGGLGGIGLTLAEYLAREARARLVLTGRKGLPPREGWGAWVAEHGEEDSTSRRIRAVEALEALGSEVMVAASDVTDAEAMRRVVAAARERFGPLNGVVHAAGVVPGGLIPLRSPEQFAAVLAPKVLGTLVLDETTAEEPLDFLVLCSSLHALYGGIGSADHCAANAFLDAYAAYRHEQRGRPTVSINWDGWTEVGQAAGLTVSRRLGDLLRERGRPVPHPLLGSVTERDGGLDYLVELGPSTSWVLDEHRVGGSGVLPGTAYLEMVRAAFADRAPDAVPVLEQVVFLSPLSVPDGATRLVRLRLEPAGEGYTFRVSSAPPGGGEGGEQEHAHGRVVPGAHEEVGHLDPAAVRSRCVPVDLQAEGSGTTAGDHFLGFGPRWTGALRSVARGDGELLAELELPEAFRGDLADYALHPALLDAATGFLRHLGDGLYLPLAYERIRVAGPLPPRLYSHVRYGHPGAGQETLTCDIVLADELGRERVRIEGYTLRRVADPAALGARPEAGARPAAPEA